MFYKKEKEPLELHCLTRSLSTTKLLETIQQLKKDNLFKRDYKKSLLSKKYQMQFGDY